MRRFSHFTYEERIVLEKLIKQKVAVTTIAEMLNKSRSSIYRELKRGRVTQITGSYAKKEDVYRADFADRRAARAATAKGIDLKIGSDFEFAHELEQLIKLEHLSPNSALRHIADSKRTHSLISLATLYNYIHAGVLNITVEDLPRAYKMRKRRRSIYKYKHKRLFGDSIDVRDKEIDTRDEFGHWEGDLIVSKRGCSCCYLTLVERKTRYVIAKRIESKSASEVVRAFDSLETSYGKSFSDIFKSITFDNGTEFANVCELERSRYKTRSHKPRTHIFYAHPYSSYERGSNENCNRLLREAGFTKGSDLGKITVKQAKSYVDKVNNIYRKVIGNITAKQAFERELEKLLCKRRE